MNIRQLKKKYGVNRKTRHLKRIMVDKDMASGWLDIYLQHAPFNGGGVLLELKRCRPYTKGEIAEAEQRAYEAAYDL